MKKGFDKGLISFKKGMGKVGTSISNGWNVFSSKTKKFAMDSKRYIERKTGGVISNPRRPVEENNENFSEARPKSGQKRENSHSHVIAFVVEFKLVARAAHTEDLEAIDFGNEFWRALWHEI